MKSPPISDAEIESRIGDHVEALLELWHAEQGASKPRDLELMASVIPHSRGDGVRALDLCCGPGDVGRAIQALYPGAQVDYVDRDPFLTALCRGVNRRHGISGRILVRDLKDGGWPDELADYHIVAVVNALHWFEASRVAELLADIYRTLRPGGVLLLAEPARAEVPFASGFDAWKARQPPRYSQENWERFWSTANDILGYDHTRLLGSRDDPRIGSDMCVAGWVRLIAAAGFESTDVLLRDADQVIIAALKGD